MKNLVDFILEKYKINSGSHSISIDNIFPPENYKDFWKNCKWGYSDDIESTDELDGDEEDGDDYYHHIYTDTHNLHLVIEFSSKDIIEFFAYWEDKNSIVGDEYGDHDITYKINHEEEEHAIVDSDDADFDWESDDANPDIWMLIDFLNNEYPDNKVEVKSEKELQKKFNL